MPLSEHEQRLLDQIERALYAEDPKFASAVRSTDPRIHARRRFAVGAALVGIGIGLLVAGTIRDDIVVARIPVLLVVGAVVAAVGVISLAFGVRRLSRRRVLRVVGAQTTVPASGRRRRLSVADKMEERWRRRDDQRGL